MFYAIAFGSSVIFSLCVLFRGLLGNWLCGLLFGKPEPKRSMVDKENTGLPTLIAIPVRKPAMFLSNYGGLVVMGGFAVLGLIGFLIGGFFAYNSLQGGLTGMAGAIWAPFALVLSPLSLFGGIFVLCWAIQHTRRYWYGWVGLIVLALASPFLLVLGHTITESIFAKSDPVALVAEEEEDIPPSWTLPEQIDAAQDLFTKTKAPEQLPGYDPSNLQGNYGIKKIHLAVLCSDLADTQAQLTAGAEINAPDEVGNTPLHLALGLGETAIAEWLIGEGANLQAKANDGRAVVHAAAAGGQVELLEKTGRRGTQAGHKNRAWPRATAPGLCRRPDGNRRVAAWPGANGNRSRCQRQHAAAHGGDPRASRLG